MTARLTCGSSRDEDSLLLSFILVPFLRFHISYSCRCQAKRMYLSLLQKATMTFFWILIFFWGTLNTGAGRPAVSPQALGRFHRAQFEIKLFRGVRDTQSKQKYPSTEPFHIQGNTLWCFLSYIHHAESKRRTVVLENKTERFKGDISLPKFRLSRAKLC